MKKKIGRGKKLPNVNVFRGVRYASQPDGWSCGPTAILNALKWAGAPATLVNDHSRLVRKTKCSTEDGTNCTIFDRVLRQEGKRLFDVRRRVRPSLRYLKKHLSDDWENNAAIVEYRHAKGDGGHYALSVAYKDGHYVSINDLMGMTVWLQPEKSMSNCFKRRGSRTYPGWSFKRPLVWFLTKRPARLSK